MAEVNVLGMIDIIKSLKVKPNFSELSRIYGLDRHTIKKYYDEGGKKVIKRFRKSGFDKVKDEIIELLKKPGVTKKGVHEYLKDKYNDIPAYSTFRHYCNIHELKILKSTTPHVRYETRQGEQLQVDWKENIKMTSKHGVVYEFNTLTSTLGFSRYHKFIYSRTKTTEDFIRCIIDTLNSLGGVPKHILTDNMSAVVRF